MKKGRFDKAIKTSFPFFQRLDRMFKRKFENYDLGDVLSEVLVEVYEKKVWLKMRAGKLKTVRGMVYTIYSRRVIDALRRQNRHNAYFSRLTLKDVAKLVSYDLINALDKIIDKGKTKEDQEVMDAIL